MVEEQQQWEVWSIPNNSFAPSACSPCFVRGKKLFNETLVVSPMSF